MDEHRAGLRGLIGKVQAMRGLGRSADVASRQKFETEAHASNDADVHPLSSDADIWCVAANLHQEGGDDRIFAETLAGTWPLVIVADGVSVIEKSNAGESSIGQGGHAAERAIQVARAYLADQLPQLSALEEVLHSLQLMYGVIVRALEETTTPGATTLLVALLWQSRVSRDRHWCFAYEGDGFITLLTPARRVDGIVVPARLLSPQKVERTAAVRSTGLSVPPAVGSMLHEPNDVIYLGSDGIVPLYKWLPQERGETLDYFLLACAGKRGDWSSMLSACPRFSDDAVLGIISTASGAGGLGDRPNP